MTQNIEVIQLVNSNGMKVQVANFGATMISVEVPNKNNELVNVVAGLEKPSDYAEDFYLENGLYLSSSVGRYAGRISTGKFNVDGKSYPIFNVDGVHLHGGKVGLDKKYWNVDEVVKGENPKVVLSCASEDGEEGYPGNLKVTVTYQLTEDNEVKITYKATTDKATPVNLTNHAYFNLNGKDSVLNHKLMINTSHYLDVDSQLIPSGKLNSSKGTRFDRNEISLLGREDFTGFDDTFVLGEGELKAELSSAESGIKMQVFTNQPASVVYTPVQLPNLPYKNNVTYSKFSAICFETQNFPDAPNHANFPNSILKPNEEYCNKSIFKFSLL
ncbi:aldose epimerase family protein [Lutibacter sp. TH_r2]|uniref:aldose epimerase family protein n=1 Tax=Lutibacter sp. TH_r2 TaxID=3082083 RepID=UPI002952B46F|nr:aldose epimerase family protein [Lutibacter sp. TH_r2]MDV7186839.1 aldose epimerase family protein [Lutibacter sp. TH_r2]